MSDEKRFVVSGSIQVSGTPEEDINGEVCGYRLPDGRFVRLAVALEIEAEDGNDYQYLSTDQEMQKVGFSVIQYDQTQFE